MNRENLIQEIIRRKLKKNYPYEIKAFLRDKGIEEEGITKLMEEAEGLFLEKKREQVSKKNKALFITYTAIAIISFIFFVLILPRFYIKNITIASIIGTIIFVFSSILAWVENKSWEAENVELEINSKKGKDYSIVVVLGLIPSVIVFFFFSSILSSGNNNNLKEAMISTTGTVVSGSSYSSRKFDFSKITVEFYDQKGQKIRATEDLSKYEFKKFGKGQKVDLIYSANNPTNIDLLISKKDKQYFMDSEERDFVPADLIKLIEIPQEGVEKVLNKIVSGWAYEESLNMWINQSNNIAFSKSEDEIALISAQATMLVFDKKLIRDGFEDITTRKQIIPIFMKDKKFENKDYLVTMNSENIDSAPVHTIILRKKY